MLLGVTGAPGTSNIQTLGCGAPLIRGLPAGWPALLEQPEKLQALCVCVHCMCAAIHVLVLLAHYPWSYQTSLELVQTVTGCGAAKFQLVSQ